MKLVRFEGPHQYTRWFVVVDKEVFDFHLVGPMAFDKIPTLEKSVHQILQQQKFQFIQLQRLKEKQKLTLQVMLLSRLKPEEHLNWRFRLDDSATFLPPVEATSFRDFYAFEAHVRNARKRRGLEMVPEWYEAPAFYFSNTACIVGHGAPITKPPETNELDYELEIAVVIGKEGGDIPVLEADDYIAGFTILNDWSARDIQRREMKVGLGPAKGKDFATSIGPYLVTPDELEAQVLPDRSRGKIYDLTMTATVNGKEYSRGNAKEMRWTFAELIAYASRNTVLKPGDLIGSGTVGTGCITEFPDGTYPWLQPGDTVELTIDGLGTLSNPIIGREG